MIILPNKLYSPHKNLRCRISTQEEEISLFKRLEEEWWSTVEEECSDKSEGRISSLLSNDVCMVDFHCFGEIFLFTVQKGKGGYEIEEEDFIEKEEQAPLKVQKKESSLLCKAEDFSGIGPE